MDDERKSTPAFGVVQQGCMRNTHEFDWLIRCSYTDTDQVPKGLGAKHTMEGVLKSCPSSRRGLHIEGFSPLVLWVFDRLCDRAVGQPGRRTAPRRSPPGPRRPNPIGLSVVELAPEEGSFTCEGSTCSTELRARHQTLYLEVARNLRRGWLGRGKGQLQTATGFGRLTSP
jgi:hypothetical protein